jgi:hypothetical protein
MLISMMQATTDLSVAEIVEYIMIGRYQPHEAELIKTTARARLSDY